MWNTHCIQRIEYESIVRHFTNYFLPEASFGLRVLSLPASVCVRVCLFVNHLLVRAITRDLFKLGS